MPAKYDTFKSDYDETRRADPQITATLLKLLNPDPNGHYLDLACGTGNYTVALAEQGFKFSGTDQSEKMLSTARLKFNTIQWFKANVDNLPFESNSFDGVMCSLAIHHFLSLTSAFTEVHRVLKTGPFVLFTAWPEQMRHYWLNHYFPTALEKSIEQMPASDVLKNALSQSGFKITKEEKYFVSENLQDLFLYSGKQRPQIYLDPNVRAGITTFWSLAKREEIDRGFANLRSDIETGKIDAVIQSYDDSAGDYIYLKAEIIN